MSKPKKATIELRSYELNPSFPVKLLTGEHWLISDTPAKTLHFHNCLEIGLCHSAEGTIAFGDASMPFHSGDVSIISCDIPHTTYSAKGTTSLWSYLFVDLSLLLSPYHALSNPSEQKIYNKLEHDFRILLSYNEYPFICQIMKEIIYECSTKKLFYEDSVRGLFATLSIKLLREYEKQPDSHLFPAKDSFSLKPALDFIRHHYMENFDIAALAGKCELSESHFRKIFSEITGQSPLEYLNHFRIEKACSLLRINERSILNISEAVGFASLSSFNRHFSALMKCTPSAYRQQHAAIQNNTSILKYSGWLLPEKL